MTIRTERVKNSTVLNIVFGMAFMLVAIPVVVLVSAIMREQALRGAREKAEILLARNLATHSYYSEILKPRLFKWTEPFRTSDYFEPSWMSSSYALRQIQHYFDTLDSAGYSMKDAVINARNPDNEANEIERDFLGMVNRDPNLVTESFTRDFDGVPYLVFLRRGEVLAESCLGCHGDPARAPAELVRQYGAERGFHREPELGTVISAISIRIPLSTALAKVRLFTFQLSGFLIALLGCFFLLQLVLNRKLLYAPIATLRDKALDISTDENRLGEQVPLPFGLELSDLATAFNKMSIALRNDRDHLEERISERSADLALANERLEKDNDIRRKTEEDLRVALDENRRLLRELQHRAKNSFAMISSLIRLVADEHASKDTKDALGQLDVRVRSISELYSYLYSSGDSGEVRLDDYCGRVVLAMGELSNSVLLETRMEAITVPTKIAAPIGLIVAELIANALKHAFGGRDRGVVTLSLGRGAEKVRLEVRDDGVGLPEHFQASQSSGTGLAILEALVAQIKGDFSMTSDRSGTSCVLTFNP